MARRAAVALALVLSTLGCEQLLGIEDRAAHPRVTIGGVVADLVSQLPVVGVEICAPDLAGSGCVHSDETGVFALTEVPADAIHTVTFRGDGYVPALARVEVGFTDIDTRTPLVSFPAIDAMFEAGGFVFDPDATNIGFRVVPVGGEDNPAPQGLEGFRVSLEPPSGQGPLYATDTMIVEAEHTHFSGIGAFLDVDEGRYELSVEGPGVCEPTHVSPGPATGRYDVIARRGYLTYLLIVCDPDPSE